MKGTFSVQNKGLDLGDGAPPPPPSLLEDLKSPLHSMDHEKGGTTENSLLLLESSPLASLQGLVSAMVDQTFAWCSDLCSSST